MEDTCTSPSFEAPTFVPVPYLDGSSRPCGSPGTFTLNP